MYFSSSPEIIWVIFQKSAMIKCARWAEKNVFFDNAQPKFDALAHLKQRKNIEA